MRSNETRKYRYDRSVYIAVIGNCGACYYCVNACPENAIKESKPPHHRSLRMHQVYEVCRSLPTRCDANSRLAFEETSRELGLEHQLGRIIMN